MDNFEYTFNNAHPNSQTLMKDDFFWSTIDEAAPFGSDDGWEAAHGFKEWREINKQESPVIYLQELIAEWGYPYFDYFVMEEDKIAEYINQKIRPSEDDIQQQINMLKEINANNDWTSHSDGKFDESLLREVVMSSSQNMNSVYLLGQDNAIIGIGFAQFVLEGRIDKDMKELTATAIKRQLLPVLISRYDKDHQNIRKEQLTKMLEVIKKTASK